VVVAALRMVDEMIMVMRLPEADDSAAAAAVVAVAAVCGVLTQICLP